MIVETNRTTLVLLRDSVDAKAWDLAANAAHRLAGSARMLECDNLVTLINELEAAARARQDVLVSALLSQVVGAVTEFEISVKLALGVSVQP
jgi:HPt (histidine-containing phosphotransfer) domain-containing protein